MAQIARHLPAEHYLENAVRGTPQPGTDLVVRYLALRAKWHNRRPENEPEPDTEAERIVIRDILQSESAAVLAVRIAIDEACQKRDWAAVQEITTLGTAMLARWHDFVVAVDGSS